MPALRHAVCLVIGLAACSASPVTVTGVGDSPSAGPPTDAEAPPTRQVAKSSNAQGPTAAPHEPAPAPIVNDAPASQSQEAKPLPQSRPQPANERATAPAASTAAPTPPEEIVVSARGLSGYWRVNGPKTVDIEAGIFSGIRIQYTEAVEVRNICLLRDTHGKLSALCSAGSPPSAEGYYDDGHMTLRWWRGPANLLFHGTIDDDGIIRGAMTGGMLGMSITGSIPVTLTKVEADHGAFAMPSRGEPMTASLVRAVLTDLRRADLTAGRYTPEGVKRLQSLIAHPPSASDAESITYLGTIYIRWRKEQPETEQDIYKVMSPTDEALCRIGLDDHGQVVDFDYRSVKP